MFANETSEGKMLCFFQTPKETQEGMPEGDIVKREFLGSLEGRSLPKDHAGQNNGVLQ